MRRKRIVAFVANRPCADINQVRRVFAANQKWRHEIVAYYLFDRPCIVGQMLSRAFGELCNQIVWEHPYTSVPERTRGVPADLKHMRRVIEKFDPLTVMSFGVPEVEEVWDGHLILGPHPASRRVDTERRLAQMAVIAHEDCEIVNGSPGHEEISEATKVIQETWLPNEQHWRKA